MSQVCFIRQLVVKIYLKLYFVVWEKNVQQLLIIVKSYCTTIEKSGFNARIPVLYLENLKKILELFLITGT